MRNQEEENAFSKGKNNNSRSENQYEIRQNYRPYNENKSTFDSNNNSSVLSLSYYGTDLKSSQEDEFNYISFAAISENMSGSEVNKIDNSDLKKHSHKKKSLSS